MPCTKQSRQPCVSRSSSISSSNSCRSDAAYKCARNTAITPSLHRLHRARFLEHSTLRLSRYSLIIILRHALVATNLLITVLSTPCSFAAIYSTLPSSTTITESTSSPARPTRLDSYVKSIIPYGISIYNTNTIPGKSTPVPSTDIATISPPYSS